MRSETKVLLKQLYKLTEDHIEDFVTLGVIRRATRKEVLKEAAEFVDACMLDLKALIEYRDSLEGPEDVA